jgi:hypothetical protein
LHLCPEGAADPRRPDWALYYVLYITAALYITGVWALFEEQPAYVFTFPSNVNDAIFHLATAVLFSVIAAIQLRSDRIRPVSA